MKRVTPKRRRRRRKKKNERPLEFRQGITLSIIIHLGILIALVVAAWWNVPADHPGSALFVDDVIIGDGDDGGATAQSKPTVQKSQPSSPESIKTQSTEHKTTTDSSEAVGTTTTGNGEGTGVAGTGSGGTPGAGNPVLAEIRRRIERAKHYPEQARLMRQEGRVRLRFRIQDNGIPTDITIIQSSGVPTLDSAAMQAVERSAPLPLYSGHIQFPLVFTIH
ncbi:MAG: hypothetical protein COV45_02400 [Deltaproteobacteria bacterium CG11_big_fil_rev_8_21_14_0_20_47_16]|nr:MAG: hypothetical protein COV45_02400 [Deltaproteobacteria bacterium CG11_big_fil_rev_8_21_14_0_20_47_16]